MIPVIITLQKCNESLTVEEYREEFQNLGLGIAYFTLGTIFVLCYVPCLIVMLRKEQWSNICYKLMFFDGVFDIGTLVCNAFGPGIIMIVPYDYNCYPNVNQFIMDIWALFWNASCFTTVSLAINRLIFLTSPKYWTERLYGGKRVWIWIIAAHLFGWAIFIPYRTPLATMIVDTKLGIYVWPENIDKYGHVITTVTNVSASVLLLIPYILTLVAVHKMANTSVSMSAERSHAHRLEKRMLLQVMVICSLTITTCVLYPISPFITDSIIFFRVLHFIWICSHGCSGILFLVVNYTIRKQVLVMFGIREENRVSVITTVMASTKHVGK